MITDHDYLEAHLHRNRGADDPMCVLCKGEPMTGYLLVFVALSTLKNVEQDDLSLREKLCRTARFLIAERQRRLAFEKKNNTIIHHHLFTIVRLIIIKKYCSHPVNFETPKTSEHTTEFFFS